MDNAILNEKYWGEFFNIIIGKFNYFCECISQKFNKQKYILW